MTEKDENYSRYYKETSKTIFYSRNEKYKDPKADIIFKKIFGKKEYLIDLLNAILKFKDDEKITDLHYLDEQVFTKTIKNSQKRVKINAGKTVYKSFKEYEINPAIYVHCLNGNGGIYFIGIRIQYKGKTHYNNIIINDSLTSPNFFETGKDYTYLKEIYFINILDHIMFYPDKKNYKKNYYCFGMFDKECSNLKIDDISFIFIELPRFKNELYTKDNEKRLKLWQNFLTSYNFETKEFDLPIEVLEDEILSDVVENCRLKLIDEAALNYKEYEEYIMLDIEKINILLEQIKELKKINKINEAKLKEFNEFSKNKPN